MIYKVTFDISTLYIKFHQLKNYNKKQEKLIHEYILYTQEISYMKWKANIA